MNDAPHSHPHGRAPWREPMLWLVVGIPVAAVLAGILTVVIAVRASSANDVIQPSAGASPHMTLK